MFLKVFKEKSNQKFVDKTLSSRNIIVNRTKVVSAGILLNDSEYFNYEEINAFLDEIGIASTKRKFFRGFVPEPQIFFKLLVFSVYL